MPDIDAEALAADREHVVIVRNVATVDGEADHATGIFTRAALVSLEDGTLVAESCANLAVATRLALPDMAGVGAARGVDVVPDAGRRLPMRGPRTLQRLLGCLCQARLALARHELGVHRALQSPL